MATTLIYITGPSGAGKSTICKTLSEMGYKTYDTDKGGVRHWIDQKTGEALEPFTKGSPENNKKLNDHLLGLPKKWLHQLKYESMEKIIFICGTSPVDHAESGIFDQIIVLSINQSTLINRLKDRENNNYGKSKTQLDKAVRWRQATIERYKQAGAHELDGTLPISELISKILSLVRNK